MKKFVIGAFVVVVLLAAGVGVVIVPAFSTARHSAKIVKYVANGRQLCIGMASYFSANSRDGAYAIPPTWNAVFPYMVEGRGNESLARDLGGPNIDEFSMGPITTLDMMTGAVQGTRVFEVAEELGIPDQSWEFVMGYWISRHAEDFRADDPSVLTLFTRQTTPDGLTFVVLITSDCSATGGEADRVDIHAVIDHNRAARERLGLAPFPPEFESWILTGEPASVGEGTFVPPRLEFEEDGE